MARRLRVALVHPFAWPEVRRGGERYLDDLAWYLAAAGHEVDVITGTTGRSRVEEADGVRHVRRRVRVPEPLRRRGVAPVDAFGAYALSPLLRRRYDVVHALTPTAAIAARAAGQRVLYTVLGHPTPEQFGRRPGDRRLVAAAVRLSTDVVALSRASAARVERMFGRRPGVLPPGVRTDRFPVKASAPPSPTLLFSADASDARKGVDVVLRAVPLLRAQVPAARVQLSGPGDHSWAVARLDAAARAALDAVDVLGPGDPDEVPARYRAATVTLLPARHEAFGLALVESLASGTPVVCAADGGMPEIVDDDAIGRVVPLGDAGSLADAAIALCAVAADPGTREACARHARRWDWATAVGPAHEARYRALV